MVNASTQLKEPKPPKDKFATKDATRRAMLGVLGGFFKNRESYNWMWGAASKAPMLTKKTAKDKRTGKAGAKKSSKGNLIVKTNRACRSHSYKVMVAGASAEAWRVMAGESQLLRRKTEKESAHCPAFPSVSDAALLNLEHILIGVCQTYFGRAIALKNSTPPPKDPKTGEPLDVNTKVTGKMQQEACMAVNEQIALATSMSPGIVRMAALPKPMKAEERAKFQEKQKEARAKKKAAHRKKLGLAPVAVEVAAEE